jgi:enamine deaminase RidA (YjgF/YER057c/UK114 family)
VPLAPASAAVHVRKLVRRSFTEHYLTVQGPVACDPAASAAETFARLAEAILAESLVPVAEKLYAPGSALDRVVAARRAALAAHGLEPWPHSYTARGDDDDGPVSVQLWAVAPAEAAAVRVETVAVEGRAHGRLLSAPGLRLLWLGAIGPGGLGASSADGPEQQAGQMLGRAEAALAASGFTLADVLRTWIYLRDILAWYPAFNRVRTAFLQARGIGSKRPFPASTGVQGETLGGSCMMDLIALQIEPRHEAVRTLTSSRQPDAFGYGSAFSRGTLVADPDGRTVLVSGTASIGPDGRTRHVGDPEAQVVETLLGLAAVLSAAGASLGDVCAGTLYCSDPAALAAFERVTRLLGLPPLPLVPLRATLCRADLLVEIDAVALSVGPACAPW